jgi:hypothetical protein
MARATTQKTAAISEVVVPIGSSPIGKDIKVTIPPPNFQTASITVRGIAPYVQHNFSKKARTAMEEKQRAGSQATKGRKRAPRNFEEDYKEAMHISTQGWPGVPASAFRNAMISACRLVGFRMTVAKLSLFIVADGRDTDGTPLVRIEGEPRLHEGYARNETGVVDLRWRPMWDEWSVTLRVRWDADLFSATDIVNLLARAGEQVGIGEGRPDSPNSYGVGWGQFEVVT